MLVEHAVELVVVRDAVAVDRNDDVAQRDAVEITMDTAHAGLRRGRAGCHVEHDHARDARAPLEPLLSVDPDTEPHLLGVARPDDLWNDQRDGRYRNREADARGRAAPRD